VSALLANEQEGHTTIEINHFSKQPHKKNKYPSGICYSCTRTDASLWQPKRKKSDKRTKKHFVPTINLWHD
jgi:hypothetical protein